MHRCIGWAATVMLLASAACIVAAIVIVEMGRQG